MLQIELHGTTNLFRIHNRIGWRDGRLFCVIINLKNN